MTVSVFVKPDQCHSFPYNHKVFICFSTKFKLIPRKAWPITWIATFRFYNQNWTTAVSLQFFIKVTKVESCFSIRSKRDKPFHLLKFAESLLTSGVKPQISDILFAILTKRSKLSVLTDSTCWYKEGLNTVSSNLNLRLLIRVIFSRHHLYRNLNL